MFDVSFTELIVIGIVALIVIGPERLPRVARTVGHLLGRAQRYVNDVKADINREIQLEELKKLQAELADSTRAMEETVRKEVDSVHTAFSSSAQEALAELEATQRQALAVPADPPPDLLSGPVADPAAGAIAAPSPADPVKPVAP